MKQLFIALIIVLSLLTLVGVLYVRPNRNADRGIIQAVWELSDEPAIEKLEYGFRSWCAKEFSNSGETVPSFHDLSLLKADDPKRADYENRFRRWYNSTQSISLTDIPRLVWATDDNPARQSQIQRFRKWHLEKYGELIDVVTDPASRDTREGSSVTKPVIQSIGGAGADILETYGPKQLEAMVRSGIALDVTKDAAELGFEYTRCFEAGWSSFVYKGKQYGLPANIGYVVLFYHKDLAKQAGVTIPTGGWTIEQLNEIAQKLSVESSDIPGGKRWGIVGMSPWPMALAAGAHFFTSDGTRSIYNSPEAARAFQAYLDLMYKYEVMPTPADTASMAAAGGFTGGGNNGLYFAAKLSAMTIGGRWEYVTYAESNYERVIRPALQRASGASEVGEYKNMIARILQSLDRDPLSPLSHDDYELIRNVLKPDDRNRLMQIGVAHVPTLHGDIKYTDVGARVAIVNRQSKHRRYAVRFLQFFGSEEYNELINQTFDSICGVVEYCTDDNGISGLPEPLPGLEDFDSPVFVKAMDGAESQQLSPFIGPERLGYLAGQVMDQLTNNRFSAAEAARLIQQRINEQIRANLIRDPELRRKWEEFTGETFDPQRSLR